MAYLLDTNICIYLIKNRPASVRQRFEALQPGQIAISSITYSELEYGVEKSSFPEKNHQALLLFVQALMIEPFGVQAGIFYGKIRAPIRTKRDTYWASGYLDCSSCAKFRLYTGNEQ